MENTNLSNLIVLCKRDLSEALAQAEKPMAYVMGEDEDGNPKEYPNAEDWDSMDKPMGAAVALATCYVRIEGFFKNRPEIDFAAILWAVEQQGAGK